MWTFVGMNRLTRRREYRSIQVSGNDWGNSSIYGRISHSGDRSEPKTEPDPGLRHHRTEGNLLEERAGRQDHKDQALALFLRVRANAHRQNCYLNHSSRKPVLRGVDQSIDHHRSTKDKKGMGGAFVHTLRISRTGALF